MDKDLMEKLGPLAGLAGNWEGEKGNDTAPSESRGTQQTPYRETMKFEPLGPVGNHEQTLFGLRYELTAWPEGQEAPFHEDRGYWLWDAANQQVMRGFVVPRGVTILAGGTAAPDAKSFELTAELGSPTYGISSNIFLDQEFQTVKFVMNVNVIDDQTFSYEQDTQIKIKGQSELFHHIDKNTLRRVD